MTTKKALITGISALSAFVFFMAPGAHAATNVADIINSGDGLDFNSSASTNTNVDVNNTNVMDIMQHIDANVSTGGNDASRNIGDSTIMTGNATVGVGMQVAGNHNTTALTGLGSNADSNLVDVVSTGDDARVSTNTDRNTFVGVRNYNEASVHQMGDIHATTGGNDANRGVGGAGIMTGNADVAVGLSANTNHNATALNLGTMSSQNGAAVNAASLVNTGDDMSVYSDNETRTRVRMENDNRTSMMQHFYSRVDAGENDNNRGIGGSMIDTGMTRLNVGTTIQGNHNTTMFGSLLDALFGWF